MRRHVDVLFSLFSCFKHISQAETINRLLKKQSRPKNKRTNTTESGIPTPKPKLKTGEEGDEGEGEEEEEEPAENVVPPPEDVKPTMYRWVSSLGEVSGSANKTQMIITFSVPESVSAACTTNLHDSGSEKMEIDSVDSAVRLARGPGVCAIKGCGGPRKYRLPKDWTIGACGFDHLRILATRT